MPTPDNIRSLVEPGRVHRSVYTDPDIFDLELERVFGNAWIYVGHESEIERPGDFIATRIGKKPLLLARDLDSNIALVHNQCAHRGVMVVASDCGHTDEYRCCYHGWTYELDGRIKAAPLLHGYPPHFDPKNSTSGMKRVPRVASYRGFVFGSFADDGPSLTDFLGYMTTSFDDMVDRAPDGGLEVAGGVFKHRYRGNWKLYLENLC
ncbi:MAG: Rieske 2Fe-2S domain-containing protein, partial [Xanthobacteraceae bacterium]